MASGDRGDIVISQTAFYGGMGTDSKIGIKNSYADTECMDSRKSPSKLSVLPEASDLSGSNLGSLINSMEQTPDGVRWGIATDGKLYKISTSNVISLVATLSNWTAGTMGDIAYWGNTDSLYITGTDRIYRYGPISGSPSATTITGTYSTFPTVAQILQKDRDGKWVGNGVSRWVYMTGGSGSYDVPTSISETDDNKCIFLPDQAPMIAIDVEFNTRPGSGTVTLTIHDADNNVVATSTIDRADVSTGAGDKTRFIFSQTKLMEYKNFGKEYHLHITGSVSGFKVNVYEASKLYGLHFYYYSALLYSSIKKYHPIINWSGAKLLIGNGQYLTDWLPSGNATVDESEYQRHRVIVENGMEVTSLTTNDEYIVLGAEKVGTVGSRPFQQGMLGFWDGVADALNFKIDTPMGDPKSLYTYENITYMIIDGAIYAYTGGKVLVKIRTLQDSQSEFSGISDDTSVYNKAMTVRRGILLMAYPSITSLKTMRYGIYSFGAVDKNYPKSFYYSYGIPGADSKYNSATYTYEIGGVWNYGDNLYYSYKIHDVGANTNYYNMASIDNSSLPAKNFKYESLAYDGGMPFRQKMALRIVASFDPLPNGTNIKLKYKIDNGSWIVDTKTLNAGDTETYLEINKRFHDIQFGFDGVNDNTNDTTTKITSVALNARDLGEEGKAIGVYG